MKRLSLLFLALVTAFTISSCGAGPEIRGMSQNDVAVNIEAGAVDVDVNQAFTATFAVPMLASSVNENTFYIVESSADASISKNISIKASALDDAIPGTVAPVGSGSCVKPFTLTPDEPLSEGANCVLHLTSGIQTCDMNRNGPFTGSETGFVTASAGEECVETESCEGECGGTGYSDNDGTTCYTTDACDTECPGDTTPPTVTITSAESTLTAQSPFTITITFSEEIVSFEVGNITVTNGAASNLTATTENKIYTASITPSGDPVTVEILIAAGVTTDANGNENEESNNFSIRYDTSALTVAITTDATNPTNESPFEVTSTFSAEPSGFAVGAITVTNGTAGNLGSGSNPIFTADITPTTDGEVTIEVGADVAIDSLTGAKSNTAAAPLSRTYDTTAPTVDDTSPADEADDVALDTTVAVTFDEAMDTTTITTNTANTDCSGSFQVSSDDFTTCVQMDAAPNASNSDKTFTVTPDSDLDEQTVYEIRITTTATDLVGNALASIYTTDSGFTTEDATAPTVDSTDPANEAENVAPNTTVAVTFDETMDTSTITTNTADMTCSGSFQVSDDDFSTCAQMDGEPSASNSDKTFTVTPDSDLSTETVYKIRITTDATDTSGNSLASMYTTATGFTTRAPSKYLLLPPNGDAVDGNFGGIAYADSVCVTAYGAGYKALLVDDERTACTNANCVPSNAGDHLDWVLSANTPYLNNDDELIGITNANRIFEFPLDHVMSTRSPTALPWTGLDDDWTTGDNCWNWASNSGSHYGKVGDVHKTDYRSIAGTYACGDMAIFYCVEQ